MTPERYQAVKRIFEAVCDARPDARAALLDSHCGDDVNLRRSVVDLLRSDAESSAFLDSPVVAAEAFWQGSCMTGSGAADRDMSGDRVPMEGKHPTVIGPYRVLGVLGEGSMGVVYRAQQQNPKREVALKVIRAASASAGLLARFEYEAQLLGRLQHPGIAQVYEAGMADAGRGAQPYLAMELIAGRTLGEHIALSGASLHARIELMARVCDAVHHAHQKGVIHRDLKPSNIMVDESGQPKVLDFGVGRLRNEEEEEEATSRHRTLAGQVIGTLGYMSPEQAAGRGADIDTQTDVYALGSMLFEVVSGELPHDFGDAAMPQCLHIIVEAEPRRLGSLNRRWRGDLETIAAKALEKDRARRYKSAAQLGEDLRRFLRSEPISARPAGAWYTLRKYARRNKAMVGGLTIASLALLVGAATTTWQAVRAIDRGEAATEAANRAADLLAMTLSREEGGDPIRPRVTDIRVLEENAAWVERELDDQPQLAAKLENLIGLNYLNLSNLDEAEQYIGRALARREAVLPPPHDDLAESLHNLGRVYWHQERFEFAERQYRQALDMRIQLHGPVHKDVALSLTHLAACLRRQGRTAEAGPLYREALEIRQRLFGDVHEETAASLNNLAVCLKDDRQIDEASKLFERAIGIMVQLSGPIDLRVARSRHHLGACMIELGRISEAESHLSAALDVKTRLLPTGHPDVAVTVHQLARVRMAEGRAREAAELCREALAIQRERLKSHSDTADTLVTLGRALLQEGELREAEQALAEAVQMRESRLPGGHWQIEEARRAVAEAAEALAASAPR